jgi:hypothetical protein
MFITSRSTGFGLLGFLLLSGISWAAAIQGDVKGPDGKGVKGAEVRVERTDKKGAPVTSTTDQHGHYAFNKIELGTYTLSASATGMASTSSNQVKARADGAVRVDFNLKKQTGAVAAPKKKTHRVWVAAGPGTNIGGHYEDVADDGSAPSTSATPGANNSSSASGTSIRRFQQGASGGSHGGPGGN